MTTTLTLDQARDSLNQIVAGLRAESAALEQHRSAAGGDMMKMLQLSGPVMAKVQNPVIGSLGFTSDDEGVMNYTVAVKAHDSNEAIASLMALVHMIVLVGESAIPKLSIAHSTTMTYEEVLLSARGAKPAS